MRDTGSQVELNYLKKIRIKHFVDFPQHPALLWILHNVHRNI